MTRDVAHPRMICAVLAALGVALWGEAALAQSKPNVIVLLSDDGGYADFNFMEDYSGETTEFKTPNLDALAAQSIVATNAYVSSPVCSASRAGLLTGRYNQRFGMDYNLADTGDLSAEGIPVGELMMTEAMKQAGYRTGVFGKWHVGSEFAKRPNNQGVDEYYGIVQGGRPYFATGGVAVLRNNTALPLWQNEPSFNNIPPDPVLGRHFTDALGDEASQFVANNANQADPFFMYVPFTAPHGPYDKAKQQDLAEFDSTSLTSFRKNVAALTFAMDRAIGNIMARVNDPNGDGNTSDSVADNTIIVFANDNGGQIPTAESGGQTVHDNGVLKGFKGQAWEGGIRVPMIIHLPGGPTGVYNQAVSTLDLMPTFLAAADATIPANLDGENLLPYLEGTQTGAVHEALFVRGGENFFAVRKGDWKLVKGAVNAFPQLYALNPDGTGEDIPQNVHNPSVVQDLVREFVDWEATLAKPTQTNAFPLNRFDAFRHRSDGSTTTFWRDANLWVNDAQPTTMATMRREDPYANAALVFHPRDDASYTSENNISRATGISYTQIGSGFTNISGFAEFMLNELRFDGQFNAAADRSGELKGYPLMFVKNLSGQGPRLTLNSADAGAGSFTFNVNMDIVLHADLEITGNSPVNYVVGGQIRNFSEPRSITKNGTSVITLAGNNTYSGNTIINQGALRIDGATAALTNTATVQVGSATLALASGLIRTPSLQIAAGGTFNFTGGVLEVGAVHGNLVNNGGEFRPGMSAAQTALIGNYTQNAGAMGLEIGGTATGTFDQLVVTGNAQLDGNLEVDLISAFTPTVGAVFQVMTTGGNVSGVFDAVTAPALPAGRHWAIQYGSKSVMLKVVDQLLGDFDNNGIVNGGDLQFWKSSFGGALGGADFLTWQRNLGTQLVTSTAAATGVPEPASAALVALALSGLLGSRRVRRRAHRS